MSDRSSQMAEKLLANSDRGADRSVCSRDAIDLIMMLHHWGEPDAQVWEKTESAYGDAVRADFEKALAALRDDSQWLEECLSRLQVKRLQVKENAQAIIRERLLRRADLT